MSDYIRSLMLLAESEYEDDTAIEKRVTDILKSICGKIGLQLAETSYPIHYSQGDREATITFYDGVRLEQLQALTDVGDNIRVQASASYRDATVIEMTIKPGMETAQIS